MKPIICALLFALAIASPTIANQAAKNYGYTPNRAETERFVDELRQRRQVERERSEAEIGAELLRRQADRQAKPIAAKCTCERCTCQPADAVGFGDAAAIAGGIAALLIGLFVLVQLVQLRRIRREVVEQLRRERNAILEQIRKPR